MRIFFWTCRWPFFLSSHGSKNVRELSGVVLTITRILSNQGPILMAIFTSIKTLSPNIVTLHVGASTYELGRSSKHSICN